jgi:hypothetical protein
MMAVMNLPAQTYTVYSVVGDTKIVQGKNAVPLEPRKQVSDKDRVLIGSESAITLLDEKNSKMFSFSAEGNYTIGELVAKASNRAKSVSKQYMSYLVKQLFSKGSSKMSHPDTYMQVTATSYRSATNDSMLLSRIAQNLPLEFGTTAEQQLCRSANKLESDLKVRFELVSCDTGFPLEGQVKGNTGCYVRVHNDTEEALYVNVLDIDENGDKYLVLPVDEAATCAHLLVPPLSTVAFKSEPFIFSEEPMKETFILVATQDPVDFSILMNPIQSGRGKTIKSGLYRNIYQVQ